MPKRKFIIGIECKEILESVSFKHIPLTITVKQDGNWQVYKSNFIATQGDRLIFTQPAPDVADCHMEPTPGQEIAVTFKKGYHKYLFTTRAIEQQQYEMDPGVHIPCLVVHIPEQIEKIQRRAYNRAKVPEKFPVSVKFWRSKDQSKFWEGHLIDLSAGGLGVSHSKDGIDDIQEDEQFILEFIPLQGQETLSVTCRFRHAAAIDGNDNEVMMGFQILGLEVDEDGLRTLRRISRVVAVFQRQEKIVRTAMGYR